MKYRPIFPNKGSPHQTPGSLLIDTQRAIHGIIARWDWDRYLRLAAFLNLTPYELASVICLTHKRCAAAQRNNRFDGCAAMLLTLLEAQVLKDYSADIIPNPLTYDPSQGSKA